LARMRLSHFGLIQTFSIPKTICGNSWDHKLALQYVFLKSDIFLTPQIVGGAASNTMGLLFFVMHVT
ncbi:hypothetical protein, partial [Vibrio sinaloensis]|uniref:hypothetical protein n=1 Tax=Photobacterium sp. (strain ATCC 43367) TaxID=379097 RepID=UPI002F3F7D48